MNFVNIAQVVVALCLGCYSHQASAHLACTGSQLTDIVRRFSQTRFETRDTKPKLARCQSFVQLIHGQTQELAGSAPGLASDEPKNVLDEISKILELRASCPGQPMGGLSSLQEFIDDCRELIELAARVAQPPNVTPETILPVDDETNSLLASIREENARLTRDASQTRYLEAENEKLSQKLEELESRLKESSGDVRDKASEIRELQVGNDQLLAESKRLQDLLVDKEKNVELLVGQKTDLARELNEARHLADAKNSELSQRLEELQRHSGPVKGSNCEELQRANEELRGQNKNLARRLDELRQFSSVRESRTIRELEDKIAQQSRVIDELKSNEVHSQTLERVNAMLGRELSEANDKLKEHARAQAALQVVPGSTREVELQRDANDELGLLWSGDIYGSVFVTQVTAGSPAARAGLKFGDQLIQANGRTTAGRDLYVLTRGMSRIKFLIRRSPMEQTFSLKPRPGEQVPGFVWSGSEVEVQDNYYDQAAARAGLLESFKLIAVNGESVLGLDGATLASSSWWPKGEFTVTIMPGDFYAKLTEGLGGAGLARVRMESNKILADEKAGRAHG